ncbi:trigger factor [Betaproteobacteria bacterium PRO7]|jgi:trigger factor|nr:trigger factor [Betaproteobacteria bacterium PRO7]
MQQNIETLGALERRVDLTVPASEIEKEVSARLNRLSRTVRMPGFRPGKVPLKMVAASYGAQVQAEVLNDKIGQAFSAIVSASKLRVAGMPRVEPKTGAEGGDVAFSATFEVYPEIRIGDLSAVEVRRAVCPVGDAEIDETIAIMRKQRATYHAVERGAADGDRVIVDYRGSLDGTPFEGGTATHFPFTVGEGRMLPEFEAAVRGMKADESKTFPLTFPADYRAPELAGRTVQFDVTVKKVEEPKLPAVDAEFAKSLGVADGDLAKMRDEIRANLEREVGVRLKSRTKESVMNALLASTSFEVPKTLVREDQQRLAEMARADLAARGVQAKDAPIPVELFAAQAERRVRLGLLLAELVRSENLQARQDQIRKAIEDIAQSYERPAEVIQWYLGNRERVAEIESVVLEDNVVQWVLQRARVVDAPVAFNELMGRGN